MTATEAAAAASEADPMAEMLSAARRIWNAYEERMAPFNEAHAQALARAHDVLTEASRAAYEDYTETLNEARARYGAHAAELALLRDRELDEARATWLEVQAARRKARAEQAASRG